MYRRYCNERGCPGHVKNWENCRELRAFAGATAPAAWAAQIREPVPGRNAAAQTGREPSLSFRMK